MLSELRIRNFALIEDLTVRLGPGFNVLTGETGAGKSIVVGALSLLVGERASAEVVREGAERASVEGVFEIPGRSDLVEWLEERGIDGGDGVLVLKREVAVEGRNRAWVNGSPTTAGVLGELGSMLVSLHGQHAHQTLLQRDEQRAILDAFGGHEELAARVRDAHQAVGRLTREIEQLDRRRREALQRADFLRFQVDEIEQAQISPDEEDRLEEEARRLGHAEELMSLAASAFETIGSGDGSASGRLASARRALDNLVRIDPSQTEMMDLFDTAYYALEELRGRLEEYAALVEHDPERLQEIRSRQDLLYRLRSKYGPTLADVLESLESARRELAVIDDASWELSRIERERDEAARELATLAAELSEKRAEAGARLAREVTRILPELGMSSGVFEVALLPLEQPGGGGAEEVEFRVSLNRGFEPRPLATVASGGELSRVMLAIKAILARLESVPTLVFDEVDAGIGGKVGLQVGEKMRQVAESHQVLAITHLPQIAARAHRHLLVRKEETADRARTAVDALDPDQRVQEVARMLGGDPESETSLAHARELLEKVRPAPRSAVEPARA